MLNRWLENEPKETLICAATSAVSLVLSITGVLKGILPFDLASLVNQPECRCSFRAGRPEPRHRRAVA